MQSQMIGLQSSLDRILAHLQTQGHLPSPQPAQGDNYSSNMAGNSRNMQGPYMPANGPPRGTVDLFNPPEAGASGDHPSPRNQRSFPPLPGFVPPV